VALGVHFASDVVAGYALGAAWVAALTAVFSAWRREYRLPPADPAGGGLEPEAGHGGVRSAGP
jgi:undecaprenyl-diphosphatase